MSEEFPSNAHSAKEATTAPKKRAAREEPKKVQKVVQGEVIVRKKSLASKIAENMHHVGAYLIMDVLIPAARDTAADSMMQGVDMVFYGEPRSPGRRRRGRMRPGSGYDQMYRSSSLVPDPRERDMTRRGRATHDFGEVVLPSKLEAEEVIDNLIEIIDEYGQASVRDLYDLLGVSNPGHTDEKYWWSDLSEARSFRSRGGYALELPRPSLLK
jgi:hypothetical protein